MFKGVNCKGKGVNCWNCNQKYYCLDYQHNPFFEKSINTKEDYIEKTVELIDYALIEKRLNKYLEDKVKVKVEGLKGRVYVENTEEVIALSKLTKCVINAYKKNFRTSYVVEILENRLKELNLTNSDLIEIIKICNFKEFIEVQRYFFLKDRKRGV